MVLSVLWVKDVLDKGGSKMPVERKGGVTFKGNPMTLLGNEIKVGDKAPDLAH